MTVKVVQGLIGIPKPDLRADPVSQAQASVRSSASSVSITTALQTTSTEAVSVSIKSLKSTSSGERIRDAKEAKDTAEKVADNIRDNSESIDAHTSLSASAGRSHLS